jgi:hypothetical protein
LNRKGLFISAGRKVDYNMLVLKSNGLLIGSGLGIISAVYNMLVDKGHAIEK